ncbi:acyl-CoA thioesterase [Parafrankia discariae]|uniref:acyl-CoA thioesterase n=1 Tax=Parafrankia discariae TaxID=365528 RepID=UPI0012B6A328|nr:acyl-CoA thioesterase domain-containing protein [Parafrankia discariae]
MTPLRITVDRVVRGATPGPPARGAAPTFRRVAAIEAVDRDVFRGGTEGVPVHPGQVAVQAQLAAGRTVSEYPLHSVQAQFPRPAREDHPVVYLVDRVRDGATSATRRVTGVQAGEVVCVMHLSYRRDWRGGHQLRAPRVPPPEALERWCGDPRDPGDLLVDLRPVAGPGTAAGPGPVVGPGPVAGPGYVTGPGRAVGPGSVAGSGSLAGPGSAGPWSAGPGSAGGGPAGRGARPDGNGPVRPIAWVRLVAGLADDQHLHAGALTYIADHAAAALANGSPRPAVERQPPTRRSDRTTYEASATHEIRAVGAAETRGGGAARGVRTPFGGKSLRAAALDQAAWFHRPFRADWWLLLVQDTPSGAGPRTFTRATFFNQDGLLVASTAQELTLG